MRDSDVTHPQVVEIASTYGAAFAGRLLAESGMPVLRLEVDAEPLLQRMPPAGPGGFSVPYLSANAKKACIAVDPATDGGRSLIDRLVSSSHVFVTDRPDFWDARGAGVTCRVRALPDDVDLRYELPSYDVPIQALSGAVSITGRSGGPPMPIGFPIGDIAPGVYAAIGVLQGLLSPDQPTVTIHALDAVVSLLSYLGCSFIAAGQDLGFVGSGHPYVFPYGAFPASDGHLVVAVFTEGFWRKLCRVLGREDLIEDPRYRTFVERREHRDELNAVLADILRRDTVDNWVARLDQADVPNAPIFSMRQALDAPMVNERGMIMELDGLRILHSPILEGDHPHAPSSRPPLMRDWRDALSRLGLSTEEVADLECSGRVRALRIPGPTDANTARGSVGRTAVVPASGGFMTGHWQGDR